jgi:GH25 family lysozyme M1 (1,4-beta-N-acetylmuramidase)
MIRGTDLSAIQTVLTDAVWKKLADDGIKFAFLRAVVGNESWVDGAAAENARRARAHGILVAPYCFIYPLPHLDPLAQADYFVRRLEGLGLMPDELPPMGDAEWPPREEWKVIDGKKTLTYPWRDKWHCNPDQIRDWLEHHYARCDELTGIEWLMYSYRYWMDCVEMWKSPTLTKRKLVLADYTLLGKWPTDEELARLKNPRGFDRIHFVQHDGDGGMRLPNGGDADFDCFLGTEEELRALAAPTGQLIEVAAEMPVDAELARLREMGAIVDDSIGEYRRNRIDEMLTAA